MSVQLIACAVVSEIFDILQRLQPYDEARYIAALQHLPTMPWRERGAFTTAILQVPQVPQALLCEGFRLPSV